MTQARLQACRIRILSSQSECDMWRFLQHIKTSSTQRIISWSIKRTAVEIPSHDHLTYFSYGKVSRQGYIRQLVLLAPFETFDKKLCSTFHKSSVQSTDNLNMRLNIDSNANQDHILSVDNFYFYRIFSE